MAEIIFGKLGNFTEQECKNIKNDDEWQHILRLQSIVE